MPTFRCPHCDTEIDHLFYSVQNCESGCISWSDSASNASQIRNSISYDDSDNNWDGNPTFTCPECEEELATDDIVIDIEDDEEPTNHKTERAIELDDTCLNGSTGIKQNFIVNHLENKQVLDSEGMITCGKCQHTFEQDSNETLDECPNCNAKLNKANSKKEDNPFAWRPNMVIRRPDMDPNLDAIIDAHDSSSENEEQEEESND